MVELVRRLLPIFGDYRNHCDVCRSAHDFLFTMPVAQEGAWAVLLLLEHDTPHAARVREFAELRSAFHAH
jgi:hypothetical protein